MFNKDALPFATGMLPLVIASVSKMTLTLDIHSKLQSLETCPPSLACVAVALVTCF